MAKIIAICNQKGGTGKTTSAINLAAYLALAGKRVLLIDVDPQGNATSGLGIDKNNIEQKSIYDVLLGQTPFSEIILSTQIPGLFLAPSSVHLTGAEVELINLPEREYRLKNSLSRLEIPYDLVFVDCPPSLGLLTINALCAAQSVIIPIQCEYYALEGLSLLLNTLELVKNNLNSNLRIEGVLLTMADYRTNLTNEVIDEARRHFKNRVYQTVIPRSVRLAEAPSFGKPIATYDKNCIGAKKYQELSFEILGQPLNRSIQEQPDNQADKAQLMTEESIRGQPETQAK
jgi:chromosome partitioning protein